MVVTLHPVVDAGTRVPEGAVETAGPVHEVVPIPDWVGGAAMAAGTVLVVLGARRRRS